MGESLITVSSLRVPGSRTVHRDKRRLVFVLTLVREGTRVTQDTRSTLWRRGTRETNSGTLRPT